MAFEFPTDLIRQLQKTLRNDAGLSSYDPVDPTLPPLPSPAYPRCKHCRGSLVCELHSLICAYCGKTQKGDVSLEPISFKSTFGCQFLLKSLGLNGSEMIGVPIKGSESNQGPITRRKRIPLSELLDLQIKWVDSLLKPETNTANKTLEHSTSFSNFTGVDVGDFFPGSKNYTVHNSYEEQPVISNQIQSSESKPVASQDNLSLFQNVQPSKTTVSSSNDVSSNAFTGWDANFQSSADSGNQHWGSKPVDSFIGSTSTVDLSAHMDSNAKGNVDWFHDNQQPTNMTTVHENDMINEGNNPFNEWNGFTSSTGAQDHSKHDLKQINCFSQADLLSGSSSHQSGSTEANNILSKDHTLDRISDAKSKVLEDIEQDMEKGNIVNVPARPSDGAETIATQMHDISFMLDSNLSVPSKSDRLSSFSQD